MKVGSLFSGGGLGDFGFLAAGMEIAWQCEIDEYCQKILDLRYPESKKYRDIKTLKGEEIEKVDIITGGFPCQPFSVAGKQKSKEDNRYLWPEMLRVIKECRPRWIIGENVPGIINLALDTVCADLEAEGYEVWPIVFPSHALGAWHKRDRVWIVANDSCISSRTRKESNGQRIKTTNSSKTMVNAGLLGQTEHEKQTAGTEQSSEDLGNSQDGGLQKWLPEKTIQHNVECSGISKSIFASYWEQDPSEATTEPLLGRVAYGIADRVHRLKMLGNGQVPACTYEIGRMIMEIENDTQNLSRK